MVMVMVMVMGTIMTATIITAITTVADIRTEPSVSVKTEHPDDCSRPENRTALP
jgi:hypothetical protein